MPMKQQALLPGLPLPAPVAARPAAPADAALPDPAAPPLADAPAPPEQIAPPAAAAALPAPLAALADPSSASSDSAPDAEETPDAEDWPPMAQMLQSMFVFEPTTAAPAPITVLGLDCGRFHGLADLPPYARTLVLMADVICGGRALLQELAGRDVADPEAADPKAVRDTAADPAADKEANTAADAAEKTQDAAALPPVPSPTSLAEPPLKARLLPLTTPLEAVVTRLSQMRAVGDTVLVLADGDPLLFGIGATLVRLLGEEAVRLLPAVSSLQQACARLALPWHKVICLSLHGRDDLGPLNVAAGKNAPLCVLTDARMSPDVLVRHLLDRGVDWFDAHIFERMGAPDETVSHLSMAAAAGRNFGPVCTLLLTPREAPRRPCLGLDSAELAVERGLISKKPVRAAALALLRIAPRHVVWDIGAGSGAVALEAAVLAHEGRVVAVERSAGRAMSIQENRRRFGVAILDVRLGEAPECLPGLPDPQRVFIGGGLSGEDGEDILGHVCHRLPAGGRVVVSCVLLETLCLCRNFFERLGWPVELEQIAAAAARPLGDDVHLAAMNPVFLLAAQKPTPRAAAPGTAAD